MKTNISSRAAALAAAIAFYTLPVAVAAPPEGAPPPPPSEPGMKHMEDIQELIAVISPVSGSNVRGTVLFEKDGDRVKITVKVGGFEPNSKHAIHIHEFGNISSTDGTSAGGHFNPEGHPHGLPDSKMRHPGDFGNLEADANGNATLTLTLDGLMLAHGKTAIIGRAVVIHAKPDDGSQPTGNAGDRIGVGVIGVSKVMPPPEKK